MDGASHTPDESQAAHLAERFQIVGFALEAQSRAVPLESRGKQRVGGRLRRHLHNDRARKVRALAVGVRVALQPHLVDGAVRTEERANRLYRLRAAERRRMHRALRDCCLDRLPVLGHLQTSEPPLLHVFPGAARSTALHVRVLARAATRGTVDGREWRRGRTSLRRIWKPSSEISTTSEALSSAATASTSSLGTSSGPLASFCTVLRSA